MIEALQYEFMRNALAAGLLASIACGIVGTYVVVKRIVFISGGISHTAYGGIGLCYFLGFNPILGAIIFSLAAALGISLVRKTSQREDTLIGAVWAMGMAVGTIFIGLTPGYTADLFGYLFGSILAVPLQDIVLMLVLDGIIALVVLLLYKEFLALSFDEEFTAITGVPVDWLYRVLLCLIALTVVILIRVVGVILVIALMAIPAAISEQFTGSLKKIMFLSVILGAVFTALGLWLSYLLDLQSGATIVIISGTAYVLSVTCKKLVLRRLTKDISSSISNESF